MSQQLPQYFWARLKPYNPKRGSILQRMHIFGRLWHGGAGLHPDDIPEWVMVTPALAQRLILVKQRPNDAYSRRAFDVVTEALKLRIDRQEESFRRRFAPVSSVGELPDVSAPMRGHGVGGADEQGPDLMEIATGQAGDEPVGTLAAMQDSDMQQRLKAQSQDQLGALRPVDLPGYKEEAEAPAKVAPQVEVPKVQPDVANKRTTALKSAATDHEDLNTASDPIDDLNAGDDDADHVEGEKVFVPGRGMVSYEEAQTIKARKAAREEASEAAVVADIMSAREEPRPAGVLDVSDVPQKPAELADMPAPKAAPKRRGRGRRRTT